MISTLNIAKLLHHNVFGTNPLMTIRHSGRISNRSFMFMHTYKLSGLGRSFPFTVIEYKRVFINVYKYLAPAIRAYSSEFNQKRGKNLVVKIDPVAKEFLSEVAGLGVARIRFERHDQLVILKHTDVPNQLSGRGIGKILAKEALEYVAKNDLQLEIHCPFIRHFVSTYEPKYIKYIKK